MNTVEDESVRAQVVLPDMQTFTGDFASTREQVGIFSNRHSLLFCPLFLFPSPDIWIHNSSIFITRSRHSYYKLLLTQFHRQHLMSSYGFLSVRRVTWQNSSLYLGDIWFECWPSPWISLPFSFVFFSPVTRSWGVSVSVAIRLQVE